jgi:hypothetical protein
VLRYTTVGDANVDGTVNSMDFGVVAANYNTTGDYWYQGDFNFDGQVNALDFNMVAANFGQVLPSAPPDGGLAALVPEPAGIGIAIAALATLHRRRRRQRA